MGLMEGAKHFVLVHGACLGAWCWYKLVTMLKLAGHKVTALDLGASGVNPKLLGEMVSFSDYLQPLTEFMTSVPRDEKVVLVGHSYGGLCISLAMEKFPERISVAIFVSAYMPDCKSPPGTLVQKYFNGETIESLMDCHFTFDRGLEHSPTSAIFGPEYLKIKLYQYCEQEDLELAQTLIRPTRLFTEDLMASQVMPTEAKFGLIRRVFILCEHDQVMTEDFQRYMIENNPPEEVKLIKGGGHMVMISRPKELCQFLEEIAEKYH